MFKRIAHRPVDYVITEDNTHIHWDYNLAVDVPIPNGTMFIDGDNLHKRLKATLLESVPDYMEKKGNFLVAALTLVASNGDSARAFTQPISVIVKNKFYEECFTDSGVFDVSPKLIYRHVNQRLSVAKDFNKFKCDHAIPFSGTVFRSGSVYTPEVESPVKRRRTNS